MESSFDPYRKWLGIPPGDQPPHHYRLLGVEPFESDPDVIANAADARMAHVKTFQTGKHSDLSQELLNEIAAAKVCLLQPEKKAQYDRALHRRLEAKEQAARAAVPKAVPVSSPSSLPSGPQDGGVLEAPVPSFSTRPASSYVAARKRRSWQTPVAILIAVALLAGGLVFLMARNGAPPVVGQRELPLVSQDHCTIA